MMKKLIAATVSILTFCVFAAVAQPTTIAPSTLSKAEIDAIIAKFTENEGRFREALTSYAFYRNASISTIGLGGQITGTFRRDSFLALTKDGKRIETILFAPVPTVPPTFITVEDLEDLGGVTPFALEPSAVAQYNFTYLGKEKIDELNLHVFEVTPKVLPDPKKSKLRLFTGRVWVDDTDLMIVKSKGKGVPETKQNKFPVVETWRENVDGKYWFPSFASSDDELVFDNGSVVKLRLRVKYTKYGIGRTDVTIGEEDIPEKPEENPAPKKP